MRTIELDMSNASAVKQSAESFSKMPKMTRIALSGGRAHS